MIQQRDIVQDESSDDEPGGLLASLQRSQLAFPKDGGKGGNMDRNMDDDSLVSLHAPQLPSITFRWGFCHILRAVLMMANELLSKVMLPQIVILTP